MRPAGGAAGKALEPGSRKRRRGPRGRVRGAGHPAGSAPKRRRLAAASRKEGPMWMPTGRAAPMLARPWAPREHERAQGWTVPGPYPEHGPASEDPRNQNRKSQVWGAPGLPSCQSTTRVLFSVVDLVSADPEEVAQKCGLSYKALVALRRVLLAQFSAFPFNGADLYEELKTSTAILSTGVGRFVCVPGAAESDDELGHHKGLWTVWSSLPLASFSSSSAASLDKLLDAGLYTGEVTEIVGGPGSGKTQVCLCVAANVAYGLQQNVLYIDSSGGLTASRILQLLQAKTPDEEQQAGALRRIQVVHAFDIFQMLGVLQDLRGSVAQQRPIGSWHLFPLNPKVSSSSGTVKVVVVDSVTAVVSPLLGGLQREGLALMMQLARELKTLARDLGVAVVVRKWARPPLLPTGFQEMVDIKTWGSPQQGPLPGDQTWLCC
ncbi:hypothetical protein MC885_003988 [Smutsia gigantea]|nr:hypothetical protein MC885_003988 [Smutsia gigantea]